MVLLRRSDSATKKEILESLILNGPLKFTHISSKAHVNHRKLKKYIDSFLADEFITEKKITEESNSYMITSKGLCAYKDLHNLEVTDL